MVGLEQTPSPAAEPFFKVRLGPYNRLYLFLGLRQWCKLADKIL